MILVLELLAALTLALSFGRGDNKSGSLLPRKKGCGCGQFILRSATPFPEVLTID
jgi:hypothetical protein